MNYTNVELYDLSDGIDETVQVKPCRKCLERRGIISKPTFRWFSDDVNFINSYRVECQKCKYGMVSYNDPKNVEERWNNWNESLESWINDLDW